MNITSIEPAAFKVSLENRQPLILRGIVPHNIAKVMEFRRVFEQE